jgi:hypothetical protein
MGINRELKKAQLDKDWSSIKRIFDKLNNICQEEADMNVLEFLEYRENTSESCRFYSIHSKNKIGPYKKKLTGIERNFQEDMINDMDSGEMW